LVGGFNPSEKYESVGDDSSQYMEEKKHVPNHQPDYIALHHAWFMGIPSTFQAFASV
jgi:hypothetical protein